MTETEHDAELVRRFNAGDQSAFVEMVDRHKKQLYTLAHSMLRNHADAEEIVNDTFIRAHRGLANFRGDSSLKTWLYCVCTNLSRNRYWYWCRRKRAQSISMDVPLREGSDETFGSQMETQEIGPIGQLTADELAEAIVRGMDELAPKQREILRLRNTLHLDYATIAATLGIDVGTVKSRIARARDALRVKLSGSFPELIGGEIV